MKKEIILLLSLVAVAFIAISCGSGGGGGGGGVAQTSSDTSVYSVYGINNFLTQEHMMDRDSENKYSPEDEGYTLLGSASSTGTFNGSYDYYAIVTDPGNVVYVDSVSGNDGTYYSSWVTGNMVMDYINADGAPDEKYVSLGTAGGEGVYGCFFLVRVITAIPTSVTVHTK